jgi:hypothetical protein
MYCLCVYFCFLIQIIVCENQPCVSLKFIKLSTVFTKHHKKPVTDGVVDHFPVAAVCSILFTEHLFLEILFLNTLCRLCILMLPHVVLFLLASVVTEVLYVNMYAICSFCCMFLLMLLVVRSVHYSTLKTFLLYLYA